MVFVQNAPCWCPFEKRHPRSDDEYFEALAAAVFSARFTPEIVRARWPSIRAAFAEFDLRLVSSWPDSQVDRLLAYPGMIRNRKKVTAVLRNGREFLKKAERYGAVRAYLDSYGGDESALVHELDRWMHYIGAPSIRCFLYCVGILERKW
jgi:DNA-3-methyladenine glycosylase I